MTEQNFPFNPLSMWQDWTKANQDLFTQTMQTWMGTDDFTQSLARALDSYLLMQSTFNQTVQQCVEQTLRTLSIASLGDVNRISELIVNLENKVDALAGQVNGLDMRGATRPVVERLESMNVASSADANRITKQVSTLEDRVNSLAGKLDSRDSQKAMQQIVERLDGLAQRLDAVVEGARGASERESEASPEPKESQPRRQTRRRAKTEPQG